MTLNVTVVPFKATQLLPNMQERIVSFNEEIGWNEAQTRADFAYEYAEYYVLLHEQQLIGYVGLHNVFGEVTFNTVVIDPKYRRIGLGVQLLQFVLEQLRHRGVANIFLEVRQANEAAQRLYQKVGFTPLIVRPNYYRNPTDHAVIMQIPLSKGANT